MATLGPGSGSPPLAPLRNFEVALLGLTGSLSPDRDVRCNKIRAMQKTSRVGGVFGQDRGKSAETDSGQASRATSKLLGEADHNEPYPRDHGIRFELAAVRPRMSGGINED